MSISVLDASRRTLRRSETGNLSSSRIGQMHPCLGSAETSSIRSTVTAIGSNGNVNRRRIIDNSDCEESETLKKCLEIFSGNKLNRDNVWSLPLIDSLSNLAARHHKTLNNFRVVGTSLEASTRIYSLRVDSIHTDVLRMSAELNAHSINQRRKDKDNDNREEAEADDNDDDDNGGGGEQKKNKPKRARKTNVTVTKNRETLNARLDTVSSQYPIFAKLNSDIGSIISPSRLLNNVLLTIGSELQLCTKFAIWDGSSLSGVDCTDEDVISTQLDDMMQQQSCPMMDCDALLKLENLDRCFIRPLLVGYRITNTPDFCLDNECLPPHEREEDPTTRQNDTDHNIFHNDHELSMAFDMNAECEPLPSVNQPQPIICVNYDELDDLTADEHQAINRCGGLREDAVVLEDLRPVDSNSQLEYSYRPLDKISQFWAGPSYWKLRRTRYDQQRNSTTTNLSNSASSMQQSSNGLEKSSSMVGIVHQLNNRRKRGNQQVLLRKKGKLIEFDNLDDYGSLFLRKGDSRYKDRKANFQKWDMKKLRLPTDHKLTIDDICAYALNKYIGRDPSTVQQQQQLRQNRIADSDDEDYAGRDDDDHRSPDMEEDGLANNGNGMEAIAANMNHHESEDMMRAGDDIVHSSSQSILNDDHGADLGRVSEIPTEYPNAPVRVEQILLPFAKRAKIIDMKNLKRCCSMLLWKEIRMSSNRGRTSKEMESTLESQRIPNKDGGEEDYVDGVAQFSKIYKQLPQLLDKKNAEATSFAIAFYAVLHLSNEQNLHLFQQEDLEDFHIRKLK